MFDQGEDRYDSFLVSAILSPKQEFMLQGQYGKSLLWKMVIRERKTNKQEYLWSWWDPVLEWWDPLQLLICKRNIF